MRGIDASGWTAALPLVVVVPMLALASALGTDAIIFPEGAALAMGIWVVRLPGWSRSRWRVAVLPPLFALAGVLMGRAGLSREAALILTVALALVALHAFDTRLAPAMSAAALPIVFDVRAWSYPLAVLAISVVVAIAMKAVPDGPGRYAWRVAATAWLVIATWVLVAGGVLGLAAAALSPPLFVSALEWLGRKPVAWRDGVRRWAVLAGAALAGSVAVQVVAVSWLAGSLAVVATLGLMAVLATPHPPALAIALIPQILESSDPASFTAAVAAGAAALYLGVFALAIRWPALRALRSRPARRPA